MREPTNRVRRADLVEPELSYQIVGALLDVQHSLSGGRRESLYQHAVAEAFRERNIPFREQVPATVSFHDKPIGEVRLDFLVDERVIVEIKTKDEFNLRGPACATSASFIWSKFVCSSIIS
jgi:GxxExxY protein